MANKTLQRYNNKQNSLTNKRTLCNSVLLTIQLLHYNHLHFAYTFLILHQFLLLPDIFSLPVGREAFWSVAVDLHRDVLQMVLRRHTFGSHGAIGNHLLDVVLSERRRNSGQFWVRQDDIRRRIHVLFALFEDVDLLQEGILPLFFLLLLLLLLLPITPLSLPYLLSIPLHHILVREFLDIIAGIAYVLHVDLYSSPTDPPPTVQDGDEVEERGVFDVVLRRERLDQHHVVLLPIIQFPREYGIVETGVLVEDDHTCRFALEHRDIEAAFAVALGEVVADDGAAVDVVGVQSVQDDQVVRRSVWPHEEDLVELAEVAQHLVNAGSTDVATTVLCVPLVQEKHVLHVYNEGTTRLPIRLDYGWLGDREGQDVPECITLLPRKNS